MERFIYHIPTEVIFGRDVERETAAQIKKYGGTKVLVVYGGKSAVKSGLLNKIKSLLTEAGLTYFAFGGVKPNPTLDFARAGVRDAIENKVDFILAVGGGSVIDTAKAIAHGTANPGVDIWQFWLGKAKVEKSLPVGVVLTIPAAGSEMSDSSVLTNEATGEKKGFGTDFNRPCFAIMNPELTFSLPEKQIACGVVDIMMHTLDRYFTRIKGNELTDAFAEGLLRTAIANGRIAVKESGNYQAMSELMWCSSVSHNGLTGLGRGKDFVPHKLGHELSGKFDVAHGESLAAIWGAWANYVYRQDALRFACYARRVWGIEEADDETAALAGIEATAAYFRSLGMPTSLSGLGIGKLPDDVLRELAGRCSGYGKYTVGDFVKIGEREAYEIYKMANH